MDNGSILASDRSVQLSEPMMEKIVQMLIVDEGIIYFAYDDMTRVRVRAPRGCLTIGIGLNLDNNLSREECIWLCKSRVNKFHEALLDSPFYSALNNARKLVMLNIAYNVGFHGFMQFTKMIVAIEAEDWETAANELIDSEAGRKSPCRYTALKHMLLTGEVDHVRYA